VSYPFQSSDRTAFDRFELLGPCSGRYAYSDGDLYAFVSSQGGSWAWVVWHGGRPIGGRRDPEMDAFFACREALEFISKAKGEGVRGMSEPTIARRFAGFFALFALAFIHGRLVWIFLDALLNDVTPESSLDTGLFVWGMLLLYAVCSVIGVVLAFLTLAAIGWIAWAVKGEEEEL
jgi:hypothetical protein